MGGGVDACIMHKVPDPVQALRGNVLLISESKYNSINQTCMDSLCFCSLNTKRGTRA